MSFIIDPAIGTELLIVPDSFNGHVSRPYSPLAFEQKKLNGGKIVRDVKRSFKYVFYDRSEDLPKLDNTQGVYILYKYFPTSRVLEAYVGKSKDLERRQGEHAENTKKDCLTSAVIITLPNNGLNEGDISNLENGLYLRWKRLQNVILHNLTIPSADKNYDREDSTVLEWIDEITNCVMDFIFGQMRDDFAIKSHISEECYDYIKTGKSNFTIEKYSTRKTFTICKGSILHIGDKVDGATKERYMQYVKDNKFIVRLDDMSVDKEQFYRFTEDLKLKVEEFKYFFLRKNFQYFINSKGETHKLII